MLRFCTLFDKNYLPNGLALWESLHRFRGGDFELYILCLDKFTFDFFSTKKNYTGVIPVDLVTLEFADPDILVAKSNRKRIEYYFTLSACFPLYLLKQFPRIETICSVDADIFFFSDPISLFEQFEHYSIMITPHKFTPELKAMGVEKFGIYNVSFQTFRNNGIAIRCLEQWKAKCLEWCYDRYDEHNDRFADQKYLDTWKQEYKGEVMELADPGSGIAPWNLNNYEITYQNGQLLSSGHRLIFYHFHGLKSITKKWYANGFFKYRTNSNNTIKRHLYLPYIKTLNKWKSLVPIDFKVDVRYGSARVSNWKRLIHAVSLFFCTRNNDLRSFNLFWLNKVYSFWGKKLRLRHGTFNQASDI